MTAEPPAAVVVNLREVDLRDPDVVRIDRLSKWGNPYKIGVHGDRAQVLADYRRWILGRGELLEGLDELAGKRLACWCPPAPCHGDVLLELLEQWAGVPAELERPDRSCPRCNARHGMIRGQYLCLNCARDLIRAGVPVRLVDLETVAPVDPVAEGWDWMLSPCSFCGGLTIYGAGVCSHCRLRASIRYE